MSDEDVPFEGELEPDDDPEWESAWQVEDEDDGPDDEAAEEEE